MATKKSDSTKKEKNTATLSTKASSSRKKKTAEIIEEVSQASEELNQSPASVQDNQEQPQENENVQPVLPPASLIAANAASSIPSGLIASAITSESISTTTGTTTKKKKAVLQRDERFDLNMAILAGIIHSVWGSGSDVFARLGLSTRGQLVEEDDRFTAYVTLRFADGMVSGQPITIQKGSIVKVRGYLTHREYNETLRKFLDDVRASSFFELVPQDDLALWRSISFPRHNGVMNVLEMMILDPHAKPIECFGFTDEPTPASDPVNRANVEGVVARIWEYPHAHGVDLFMRLAVYDSHTPIDPKREGNFGRARRSAHYITVRFPNGKTASGSTVRLRTKMRVRVNGELRDKAQVVTLREELLKTGNPAIIEMMGRVQNAERMNEIKSQQESLHILANAVVVYSMAGGSR